MLVKKANSQIVFCERPVLLEVDSSFSEVQVSVESSWKPSTVELSKDTESSLSLLVEVSEGRWDVDQDVRVDSVAIGSLLKLKKVVRKRNVPWYQGRSDQ